MNKQTKKKQLKYITEPIFEKHMRSIASSFEAVNKALSGIMHELQLMKEDYKEIRKNLSGFISDVSSHDRRIENLTIRVEKLEEVAKR
jgi:hypothetical protein